MKKIIIFDFNRTIYNPENNSVIAGAIELLTKLNQEQYELHLLSMAQPSRMELIENLGLKQLFTSIQLCQSKTKTLFEQLIQNSNADVANSFVVGDRTKKEIALGNQVGLTTIWVKTGKFASELPESIEETPHYTISQLAHAYDIIANHNN